MMDKIWDTNVRGDKSNNLIELLESMTYYRRINPSYEKRIFMIDVI